MSEKVMTSESELYNQIVEMLSNGNFLQLNGKTINLTELNEYINAQQDEIERLNNIINELDGYLDLKRKSYIEGFKWSGLEIIDQTKDFLQELKGSE